MDRIEPIILDGKSEFEWGIHNEKDNCTGGASYELSDRGNFDYVLFERAITAV